MMHRVWWFPGEGPLRLLQRGWLGLPALVRNVLESAGEVCLTLVLATVVLRGIPTLERAMVRLSSRHGAPRGDALSTALDQQRRVETLVRVTASVARTAIQGIALLGILAAAGVNVAPFLAGAGIVGVALGVGAHAAVRDFIAGFFILLENHYDVGDTVTIGALTGVVEQMSLRVTVLRDASGAQHFLHNGTVGNVTNRSCGWLRTSLDVASPVGAPAAATRSLLEAIAADASRDPALEGILQREVTLEGPVEFTGATVTWRLHACCRTAPNPADQEARVARVRAALLCALQRHLIKDPGAATLQWNEALGLPPAGSAPETAPGTTPGTAPGMTPGTSAGSVAGVTPAGTALGHGAP
jgi:small conductance mechanosensitive channel